MEKAAIISGSGVSALAVLLAALAGFCFVLWLLFPLLMRCGRGRTRHVHAGAHHGIGALGGASKRALHRLHLPVFAGGVEARRRLAMAGYRGAPAFSLFLIARLSAIASASIGLLSWVALGAGGRFEVGSAAIAVGLAIGVALLPDLVLTHWIERRRSALREALPDALDLMLICLQSGLPIELALQRVGAEMRTCAPAMAEELELTMAELGHLPCRQSAYERMAERTGLPAMRALALNLAQAERYGASIARTLDVTAREYREQRIARAEQLAASLGAKMAVVVVLFFLPALILILIGPVLIGPGLSGDVLVTLN
jgi:tight adherence protein C